MSQLTQDNRPVSISDFSLGKDTFLLTAFDGIESISSLFDAKVDVISENLEVSPDAIIGKAATVTFKRDNGDRYFHGLVKSFEFGEIQSNSLRQYTITLVPWLWFLTKTNNHKIFQDKNTKDIVSAVFDELGFNDYEFRAAGGQRREYCVQHNESDLNFVSRLLAEEGIAYYFKHEKSKHQLILVDQKNAYEACPDAELEYSKGNQVKEQITSWQHHYDFKKGQWSINDYNFKEPSKNLFANTQTISSFANNSKYEHYEYPGMYDYGIGEELVKVRLEAEETKRNRVKGESDCSSFYAGGKFNVLKHTSAEEKGSYIITSVHHNAEDTSYFSGQKGSTSYSNQFTCIPEDVHFRPSPEYIKPVMKGPQSALVVGPAGEDIYIDEHGRIKVQFIWDRLGKSDENSSCFLRVVQSWAGNQWGASFIPRIGHEVIVNFLDGDPDRPIVTGSVYNGKNKPTYSSKTQSGIKTRSSKGGGPQNYNELRFEDKKGAEQIYIHAEKDMDTQVENNESLTVDNDRRKHIKHDENSIINNDRNKKVDNNQTETIGKNKTIDVGVDHAETIGKNMTINVGKDLNESVDGQYSETVTKDYSLKAKTVTVDANDQIVLKSGAAKIVMKKNGDITISGKNINIKGSGNIVIKGSKVSTN